jgi:glycosyltransferase involved in cell wall biosynthesis
VAPYLTVVMPAYNEQDNLVPNATLLAGKLAGLGIDFELVIVDDGSSDATLRLADELAGHDARVRVLHHPANYGIGRALYTGFQAARGEFTIFIPSDLAMRLDDLPTYLHAAQQADVVVGLRSDRRDTSLARKMISLLNIGLVRFLFGMPIHQFQYICMYRTRLLQEVEIEYADSAFIQAEVLIKARDLGYRLTEVRVGYVPRSGGKARGARLGLAVRSATDLASFWLRWLVKERDEQGRRDWRVSNRAA